MGTYVNMHFLEGAVITAAEAFAADDSFYDIFEWLTNEDVPFDDGIFYLDDLWFDDYTSHGHGHWLVNGIIPYCEPGSMLHIIEYEGTDQFIMLREKEWRTTSYHEGLLTFPSLEARGISP